MCDTGNISNFWEEVVNNILCWPFEFLKLPGDMKHILMVLLPNISLTQADRLLLIPPVRCLHLGWSSTPLRLTHLLNLFFLVLSLCQSLALKELTAL